MNAKKIIKTFSKKILYPFINRYDKIIEEVEKNRILIARQYISEQKRLTTLPDKLSDIEFQVFSQWGEDGIIQFLISKVPIENEIFIEFGVQDYSESNTRFLLMNDNWKGLIMDSSAEFINKIRSSQIYWQHDLTAVKAFITKDNINDIIASNNISGDIGILSIDIDGNDYWIWDAISVVSPRIVICEYNSVFGCDRAITIPYKEDFERTKAHYSNLYFGASLKALYGLAEKKGYNFVGSNKAGANAFFVRKDVARDLNALDCKTGYVKSKSRESIDKAGRLTYVSGDERAKLIAGMKVYDVEKKLTTVI